MYIQVHTYTFLLSRADNVKVTVIKIKKRNVLVKNRVNASPAVPRNTELMKKTLPQ